MGKIIRQRPGVFSSMEDIACINTQDIEIVKRDALAAPLKRSRICMHKTNDDAVQEMIIAICADSYIAPHRHLGKSESFHIIEGQADIFIFEDSGEIRQIISLGQGCPDGFYYRLSAPLFHTVLSISPTVVIHETSAGPFRTDETSFASFAPAGDDSGQAAAYLAMLRARQQMVKESGK